MKKITITLLLSAFSLLSFAQSAFTEKVAMDLMQRYGNDPPQFLKTEADSMDTVSTHLRHIYDKLHVNCATAAVAKAIRERLV